MPEALKEVLEEFTRYVNNDIPIRLISLPEKKLVGRSAVEQYFRPLMDEITADMIDEERVKVRIDQDFTYPVHSDRRSAVRALVQERVQYGILSHRWLREGEPSCKELIKQRNLSGPGYEKLQRFCEVAISHGMKFAWSDTCCIDKSSSAELDESIRSMFRWYRNSAICIVLLAQSTSTGDMTDDEWFTRGWTLQELIAPKKIKFYDNNWEPLTRQDNDKNEDDDEHILSAISKDTGITTRNLLRFVDPGPFYIRERMGWAAKRTTTRDEDVAYSMTGIFDVGLQIAYGEGGDRAFIRLIEALMQVTSDTDILHWKGQAALLPHTRALPPSPAAYMVRSIGGSHPKDRFAMTSAGLRIKLAIFPSPLISVDQEMGIATLACDVAGKHEITLKVEVLERQLLNMDPDDGCKWFIGVFNYIDSRAGPEIAGVSGCYLLMTTSWSSTDWIKVSTKDAITFDMKGTVVFEEKYLRTVYL
ncbi:heterokaryon incompatibility protein-domain-containing protein [Suillus paluster]|uniref:heterokaryon incompatibility protein-domain-containing protein n=1 Tax=Suillus paluster TaxID=48578 RepID=UPI001B88483C|nr:heterokaryon incompatibility protein-domain-containing protein [Suillus paluster]KAG1731343.1 heterokaryon incompatibility protein-domain-containing protein [Suillus paluster]